MHYQRVAQVVVIWRQQEPSKTTKSAQDTLRPKRTIKCVNKNKKIKKTLIKEEEKLLKNPVYPELPSR